MKLSYRLICIALAVLLCGAFVTCTNGDDDDSADDDAADDDAADDDDDDFTPPDVDYAVVDTDQSQCYGLSAAITCGSDFLGQDAQYDGYQPRYQDNGDGTVTDLITGLMWQADPGDKTSYADAVAGAGSFSLAGHDDWRLPTIKDLYSLIQFSGEDPSGETGDDTSGLTPFIDANYFAFEYGDTNAGQRIIDSQWVTSSIYVASVMGGQECFFGVNFADGRIKCYGTGPAPSGYYTIHVRNNGTYGANNFADNGDQTVTDNATGLLWQQNDSGQGMNWEAALDYCETLDLAGHDDWRLPNAKELQSIVDYSRSPDTTSSAAIDPIFNISSITNEGGDADYPFFWTGTTHASSNGSGGFAAYVSFGRALGYMDGSWIDVHGAGAQRSDPKDGDPADYPDGNGPQGDAVRIFNYVRCVTGGGNSPAPDDDDDDDSIPEPDDDDDDEEEPPPDEAIEACEDKAAGDDCEFEGMGGEPVTGNCEQIGDVLACVPEGGPPVE
ncbi:MAG: DUF1566 domain-containing protein [Candidatus Alcyoniella australis]|nr:DUF1566 domain-containing protein [Candidatus Alcyoniella australis]